MRENQSRWDWFIDGDGGVGVAQKIPTAYNVEEDASDSF